MTLTLLLDLDDTLLKNKVDTFTPVYLDALGKHLSPRVPPERMLKTLMRATQAMILNQRPDFSLEHVSDSGFYPMLGLEKDDLRDLIDSFYSQVFPSLQSLTTQRPEAIDLVMEAIKRGYRVAVATNPLFPRTAIHQRLVWAGLPPSVIPFDLITSYESFHFAKPNPAFYSEILAHMGWPNGPAVMVGNDLDNDITPAAQAGLFTYHLLEESDGNTHYQVPNGSGTLTNLLGWLEELDRHAVQPDPTHPSAVLSILKSTPAALLYFAEQLTPEQWNQRPQPGEWSLTEILCHLRDVEAEVDLPRIQKVIREQNPFIPGMVTDPWAEERDYIHQDGSIAMQGFINCRIRLIEILETLNVEDWQRPARHAIFGPTRLHELVAFITTHDRSHIQQAYRAVQTVLQKVSQSS
jgi:FMN phosphatase YigB (HAD superfamily)